MSPERDCGPKIVRKVSPGPALGAETSVVVRSVCFVSQGRVRAEGGRGYGGINGSRDGSASANDEGEDSSGVIEDAITGGAQGSEDVEASMR